MQARRFFATVWRINAILIYGHFYHFCSLALKALLSKTITGRTYQNNILLIYQRFSQQVNGHLSSTRCQYISNTWLKPS